ncbi:PIN-like domain-containing protein [Streptococcus suis]
MKEKKMNFKDEFYGFYRNDLSIDSITKENTIIVFDTNSLLNVFRFTPEAAKKYFETIEKVQDFIYIPYLVALEFHFHKSETLLLSKVNVEKFKSRFNKNWNKIKSEAAKTLFSSLTFRNDLQQEELSSYLSSLLDSSELGIEAKLLEKISSISDTQKATFSSLIEILEQKTRKRYEQDWINEVEKRGEERYKKDIPPGFNDKNKKDSRGYNGIVYQQKFGDLIIWEDMLEKSSESDIKNVVFVTSDGKRPDKTDLNYKVLVGKDEKGKDKYQVVGPRIELIEEMRGKSGASFYLMDELEFIKRFSGSEISNRMAKSIGDILAEHANSMSSLAPQQSKDMVQAFKKATSSLSNSFTSKVKRREVTDIFELEEKLNQDYNIMDSLAEYVEDKLPNMDFEGEYFSGWGEFEDIHILSSNIDEYAFEDNFYEITCTAIVNAEVEFNIVTKNPDFEQGEEEFFYESSSRDLEFTIEFTYDMDYDMFENIVIVDYYFI